MASYQDIEVRLEVIEDVLDFILRAATAPIKVGKIHPQQTVIATFLDLYGMAKAGGWQRGMDVHAGAAKATKRDEPKVILS